MTYIADSIRDEYEQWKGGDVVFISSPTGSGKTTFVLKTLLPFFSSKDQKILYLVNRTVLKKQLEEDIFNLPIELVRCIKIELYQTLEKKILDIGFAKTFEIYGVYDCVVCDESHYFMMDSNYNTNTILSYRFIRDSFKNKIRIYMSATIENIEEIIRQDIENEKYCLTHWIGYNTGEVNRFGLPYKRKIYNYRAEKNYEHIEIGILKSRDEIKDLVISGPEKWLVFVDSKIFGNSLVKDILEGFKAVSKEESVKFITSDYNLDEETSEVVDLIVNEGKQDPKVLIATSVLDNGINIKDIELRNIIIVADTQIEFIQMLGRKRNDGKSLKLYIYKHSRNHFVRRKSVIGQLQKIAVLNYNSVVNYIETWKWNNDINIIERAAIEYQHKYWLRKMMNNEVRFESVNSLFFAFDGCLTLNILSLRNVEKLNQYYNDLLNKYDIYGDDAFLREQLSWLDKTETEIDEIISYANKSKYDISRKNVLQALERVCNIQMSLEDFCEFKNELANDLLELIEYLGKEHPDYKKYKDTVKKNDRAISNKFMDFLRNNCDIPFIVQSGSESKSYVVKKQIE